MYTNELRAIFSEPVFYYIFFRIKFKPMKTNINRRDVQRKNVVINVDMSSLWAPWLNGPYKNAQKSHKHDAHKDATPEFPCLIFQWCEYCKLIPSLRCNDKDVRSMIILYSASLLINWATSRQPSWLSTRRPRSLMKFLPPRSPFYIE